MGKLIISPKVLDSLNEINSEITTNDFGSNTVASFQTALLTFIQNNLINDGDYRSILVNISTASDVFAAQRYSGWVTKQSGSHYAITLIGINNQDIEGHYTSVSETWTWSSLNGKITTLENCSEATDFAVNSYTSNHDVPVHRVLKQGKMVTLNIVDVSNGTKYPSGQTLAILPAGYRPSALVELPGMLKVGDGWFAYSVKVDSQGQVHQSYSANCVGYMVSGSYLVP